MARAKTAPTPTHPQRATGSVILDDDDPIGQIPVARTEVSGNHVVLYTWVVTASIRGEEKGEWEYVDRLTHATMTIERGVYIYRGRSDKLHGTVRTSASEVTWRLTPVGCQDCG